MKTGLIKPLAARLLAAGLLVPLLGTATACSSSDPGETTPKATASTTDRMSRTATAFFWVPREVFFPVAAPEAGLIQRA